MKYDKKWYESLNKPKFQPSSEIFAPVWTVLYAMMGIAFLLVLLKDFEIENILASILFIIQLAINFSWSPIFFKWHDLKKAFLVAFLLSFFVLLTTLAFFEISEIAGLLMLPYFLWTIFACYLSYNIWKLN